MGQAVDRHISARAIIGLPTFPTCTSPPRRRCAVTSELRRALRQRLKEHEGTGPVRFGRFMPYRCSAGKLTLGYGRNIEDIGLSRVEAELLLDNDIDSIERSLITHLPWFIELDPIRQGALIDMAFMGVGKLLTFSKMLAALKHGDYATAAQEALASDWAAQVKRRAQDIATMLRTGADGHG